MSADQSNYIFKNYCSAKDLIISSDYVSACTQCSEKNFYVGGQSELSIELSYPDFIPEKNVYHKGNKEKAILVSVAPYYCYQENSNGSTLETRSAEIEKYLASRLSSKYEKFSPSEYLGKNLYVTKNHKEFSADEEVFYFKTPEGQYKFIALCHSYGCSSPSNPIYGASYHYSYNFQKPSNVQDIISMHKGVENSILKFSQENHK